jgi:hypothetical protein
MNKWMPICGKFTQDEEAIIFEGSEITNGLGIQGGEKGILLFGDKMLSGTIAMDVEFESEVLDSFEDAEIIFDYIDECHFTVWWNV